MSSNWQELLKDRLHLYGHRNWVVVADSAYPAQSSQGVETIVADDEQTTALDKTLALFHECRHIKPTIYTDHELGFVSEEDAPGITSYRKELADLMKGYEIHSLPHEEIIAKLDRVGATFQVLLIKTKMQMPYTSVFFELECGYWNAQAEDRIRAAMRRDRDHALRMAEGVTH
jgi:hypothetical protein